MLVIRTDETMLERRLRNAIRNVDKTKVTRGSLEWDAMQKISTAVLELEMLVVEKGMVL